MAVKLAAAMGAEVTVLSQSLKKMEDGLRLGASHYYATADRDTFKKLRNSFDLILNTVSADLDLRRFLACWISTARSSSRSARKPASGAVFQRHRHAPQPVRLGDRRHRRDPGDAGLLCRAQRRPGDRGDRTGLHQRGVLDRVVASDVRYRFVIDTGCAEA